MKHASTLKARREWLEKYFSRESMDRPAPCRNPQEASDRRRGLFSGVTGAADSRSNHRFPQIRQPDLPASPDPVSCVIEIWRPVLSGPKIITGAEVVYAGGAATGLAAGAGQINFAYRKVCSRTL